MGRETEYRLETEAGTQVYVRFETKGGEVTRYRVVLLSLVDGEWETIRVYDNRHGRHDLHRYTLKEGKQDAETFHHGTPHEAMTQARAEALANHAKMIDGWKR